VRPLPGKTRAQVRIHSSVIGQSLGGRAHRCVNVTDDVAAFDYACEFAAELKQQSQHDILNLAVWVSDEARPLVLSIPCLAGHA
jgi:hypothetical protein